MKGKEERKKAERKSFSLFALPASPRTQKPLKKSDNLSLASLSARRRRTLLFGCLRRE
jgi:hypothetical protein